MVEVKFLVEVVVIVVALAVGLWWFYTNYESITRQFFDFLGNTALFAG